MFKCCKYLLQLDVALEEVETQRNGLVFIYNMTNSKYSNFDYDLSQKMLTLLKGNNKKCSIHMDMDNVNCPCVQAAIPPG